MEITQLKDALRRIGVTDYQYYASIGSTNDEALDWADSGAHDFSLVVADEQSRGKGRFERRWVTNPQSSLAFSLILKPTQQETSQLALFAPLCGLAVHDALKSYLGIESEIKWPNDILLNRKKSCGILVESRWSGDELNGVVLGIGLNISAGSIPHKSDQTFEATCIEEVLQAEVDRYLLLEQILLQIRHWRPLIGSEEFFNHWTEHLAFKGETIRIVQSEKQSIIGVLKGIDAQGNLVLILDNQKEESFEVGDVHLRPMIPSEVGGNDA